MIYFVLLALGSLLAAASFAAFGICSDLFSLAEFGSKEERWFASARSNFYWALLVGIVCALIGIFGVAHQFWEALK